MRAYPVKFSPIIKPRIWGGDRLKGLFQVESAEPIGEYWVLSGLRQDPSVVVNGPWAGKTLVDLVREYPEEYLGAGGEAEFPLLIKFLEAEEHLSVQVHPDDRAAAELEGGRGKTEAWYILDHKPGTKAIYGHRFANPEAYWQAVRDGCVLEHLREVPLERDQLIYVPARTLHALMAGTILIEIQQTSDVTYRVYDWDRRDTTGTPRELHLEKAARVLQYATDTPTTKNIDPTVQVVKEATQATEARSAFAPSTDTHLDRYFLHQSATFQHEHLITCPYFTIEKLSLSSSTIELPQGSPNTPEVLIVAEGEGFFSTVQEQLELQAGDTLLLPASQHSYQLTTPTTLTLLRTYTPVNK